jgi:type IV pilus assembly protein PilW
MSVRQSGISAIEILIGMAVGLVLLVGMGSMVVGSRQTSRTERNLLEMQATGRIALDVLSREVRKAGFRSNRKLSLADAFPVAAAPFTAAAAVVVGVVGDSGVNVRFQGSGDTWTSDCLGNAVGANQDIWETVWLQGGELQCRVRNLTTNTDQTLALIPQVEAIAVTYGVDTSNDGFADVYRTSATVADWTRVASVKIELRVVSTEDALADAPQPYLEPDGTVVTPADRRLRRNFATVVALRNLLP